MSAVFFGLRCDQFYSTDFSILFNSKYFPELGNIILFKIRRKGYYYYFFGNKIILRILTEQ